MDIKNIKEANLIIDRIEENEQAIVDIDDWLEEYPNGDSDGTGVSSDKKLYSMHISEHTDGSGQCVGLIGSMVQTSILKFTKEELKKQIKKDEERVKEL